MYIYGYNVQILGLTASPGSNKAKDVASAKDHLRSVMTNLDVGQLSVVKKHKQELLEYSSIPEKGGDETIMLMLACTPFSWLFFVFWFFFQTYSRVFKFA